jgi:hypothetical protein
MDAPSAPPSGTGESGPPVRYVFLLGRLRNRQITMEEATELFGIMQGMVRAAAAAAPAAPMPTPTAAPKAAPPPGAGVPLGEDLYWMSILALGAGSGLAAALLRRATGGPKLPDRPSRAPASSR